MPASHLNCDRTSPPKPRSLTHLLASYCTTPCTPHTLHLFLDKSLSNHIRTPHKPHSKWKLLCDGTLIGKNAGNYQHHNGPSQPTNTETWRENSPRELKNIRQSFIMWGHTALSNTALSCHHSFYHSCVRNR